MQQKVGLLKETLVAFKADVWAGLHLRMATSATGHRQNHVWAVSGLRRSERLPDVDGWFMGYGVKSRSVWDWWGEAVATKSH